MITGMNYHSYNERLNVSGLFCLKKRILGGYLIGPLKYLKVTYKKAEKGLLTRASSDRLVRLVCTAAKINPLK